MSIMPSSTIPGDTSTDMLSQSEYTATQTPDTSPSATEASSGYTATPSDVESSMLAQTVATSDVSSAVTQSSPEMSSVMQVLAT